MTLGSDCFKFGEQTFVGEIEQMGVLPVLVERFADAADDVFVVDFDGEFAAAVEAAGSEVDGADDGAGIVGEEQLGVKLDVLQLVDLDADVLKAAQAADAFDELLLLELVRRTSHDVDLDAAAAARGRGVR